MGRSSRSSTTSASRGVLQLLVEGGATWPASFHRAGLVDQYVLYLAPALLGGDDGRPLFAGPGAPTMADVWRGRIAGVRRLGPDLRVDLLAGRGRRCRTVSVMFTGIVEEIGTLVAAEPPASGRRLVFAAATVTEGSRVGDSIAVNGCCLTVVDAGAGLVGGRRGGRNAGPDQPRRPAPRAIRSTWSGRCSVGSRLGGHLVQGHVDARRHHRGARARPRRSRLDERLTAYLVEKGSITVDGVSLTVVDVTGDVVLGGGHPAHPAKSPPSAARAPATAVNLEVDVIAKYAERLLQAGLDSPYSGPSGRHRRGLSRAHRHHRGGHRRHRRRARWSSSSTTRTARTRATSSWRPSTPPRR